MKRTTYYVIGLLIAGFLYTIFIILYNHNIQENYKENGRVTEALAPFSELRIADGTNILRERFVHYNIEVKTLTNGTADSISYPKKYVELVRRGNILYLRLNKLGQTELKSRQVNISFSVGTQMQSVLLDSISAVSLIGMHAKQFTVKRFSSLSLENSSFGHLIVDGKTSTARKSVIDTLNINITKDSYWSADSCNIGWATFSGSDGNIDLDANIYKHIKMVPRKGSLLQVTMQISKEQVMK